MSGRDFFHKHKKIILTKCRSLHALHFAWLLDNICFQKYQNKFKYRNIFYPKQLEMHLSFTFCPYVSYLNIRLLQKRLSSIVSGTHFQKRPLLLKTACQTDISGLKFDLVNKHHSLTARLYWWEIASAVMSDYLWTWILLHVLTFPPGFLVLILFNSSFHPEISNIDDNKACF